MYQGPYNYGPIQWSDFISVQHNISETDHNGFITKIKFTNNSNYAFNGTVKYWIEDKNDKEVYSETKPVQVKPEQGSETDITFSNYQPLNENIFKVGYLVSENKTSATVTVSYTHLRAHE